MKQTKVKCTDTDLTLEADILRKSDKLLEVVVDGSNLKLKLSKKTPSETVYVGNSAGLEFTSTGE